MKSVHIELFVAADESMSHLFKNSRRSSKKLMKRLRSIETN